MIFKKTELFVIETDWFDSPFEDYVYTDQAEAEKLCTQYNNRNGTPGTVSTSAVVLGIGEYADRQYNKGSEAASYD